MIAGKTSAASAAAAAGDEENPPAASDTAADDRQSNPNGDIAATQPPTTEPGRPIDNPAVLQDASTPAPDTETLDDRLRAAIRDEFQTVIDAHPADPRDFDFKVSTVKWFGILCAAALLLILFANAYFINELFRTGRAHEPAIAFQPLMMHASATERLYELAVENEALNMRNNRSVSAVHESLYAVPLCDGRDDPRHARRHFRACPRRQS
ncbi:hypothetical protein [Mesorhizobium sp. J428]|uniref:hypothetical protein n=1 Tax=Mesorhizobium sp. J428 TaxID=2898440 RepID=UPI002150CED0|nr:hypothetical protein [Mesorhizobium sp. J428]MCR5859458.1 hypothetical protein [Mesorhizobium sp. J428]